MRSDEFEPRTVSQALEDAQLKGTDIDCVATLEFWHEILVPPKTPKHYPNPPKSVAVRIGATDAIEKNQLYAHPMGGNGPQELINIMGEKISTGEIRSAVICGAEGLAASRYPSSTLFPLFILGSPYSKLNIRKEGTLIIMGLLGNLGLEERSCSRHVSARGG